MEVKAKNVSRGDEINIVSDNVGVIANIILNELCSLDEVTDAAATYKTEYDFNIENQDEITKYILLSAAQQACDIIHGVRIEIHTVHITTYYDGFPYNKISFYYYS